MSELKAFFKQNKPVKKNEFFPACADFKDAEGKTILWEIRHLKPNELNKIRSTCTKIENKGKKVTFDADLYARLLVSTPVVYPNLKDAELIDSYLENYSLEDRTPENLICEMIDNDKEFQEFKRFIEEMNGIEKKTDEEEENVEIVTAKN